MTTRELDQSEWTSFFNCFSRHYQGRRVTLELKERGPLRSPQMIARDLPFMGITAEMRDGEIKAIEILVGDTPENHLMHIVNAPSRVSVAQITNGEDEALIIESMSDPTVEIDFRQPGLCQPSLEAGFGDAPAAL